MNQQSEKCIFVQPLLSTESLIACSF